MCQIILAYCKKDYVIGVEENNEIIEKKLLEKDKKYVFCYDRKNDIYKTYGYLDDVVYLTKEEFLDFAKILHREMEY